MSILLETGTTTSQILFKFHVVQVKCHNRINATSSIHITQTSSKELRVELWVELIKEEQIKIHMKILIGLSKDYEAVIHPKVENKVVGIYSLGGSR